MILGGATALHRAAFVGHLKIVQLLLVDFGANVMLQDSDGKTALHKVDINCLVSHVQTAFFHFTTNKKWKKAVWPWDY